MMMKNLSLAVAIILLQTGLASAQTQKGFNFQGYARNAEGGALTSQTVNVQFTIYPKGNPGTPDFTETQVTTTDPYGVFQLVVGAVSTTQFKNLKFQDKDYWLKVEVKTGTSNFVTINDTELLAVPYARAADNGVPAGTIFPFAGPKSKIPFGYLACDGTLYNNSDYPSLFNIIGNGWGGVGAQFRVPDLRGMFLRGVSETATTDDDKTTRAAMNTGGNTGNDVGSVQTESTRAHNHTGTTSTDGNHSHTYNRPNNYVGYVAAYNSGAEVYRWDDRGDYSSSTDGNHSHNFTTSTVGGNETRPDNANVFYIIKY